MKFKDTAKGLKVLGKAAEAEKPTLRYPPCATTEPRRKRFRTVKVKGATRGQRIKLILGCVCDEALNHVLIAGRICPFVGYDRTEINFDEDCKLRVWVGNKVYVMEAGATHPKCPLKTLASVMKKKGAK